MTITVSFENPANAPVQLMSSMPSTEYFVARCDSTKERVKQDESCENSLEGHKRVIDFIYNGGLI